MFIAVVGITSGPSFVSGLKEVGFLLFFMAAGILGVLLFGGRYSIPELTSLRNGIADAERFPIVPMLFTTIACGALSGFHATQSPLMARCLQSERQCRAVEP